MKYAVALLGVALVCAVQTWAAPWFQHAQYILCFPLVIAIALWAGPGPAAMAAVICGLSVELLLVRNQFEPPFFLYLLNVILIVGISHRLSARRELLALRKSRAEEENLERQSLLDLNRVSRVLLSELDLKPLLQRLTDETTVLSKGEFGAFFYNITEGGESYMLYTLSGVPRERFSGFPMPRNTEVFAVTFNGEGTLRLPDVQQDPRFGKNAPYHGMPEGHLPVRSYLAVPVVSRQGKVMGGLFFGHSKVGVFTERVERLIESIAAQATIAIENAVLYQEARELAAKESQMVEELKRSNDELSRFAHVASHDLKEPMRMVTLYAAFLQERYRTQFDSDGALYLKCITEGATRMKQLLNGLLAYSRISRSGMETSEVDLDDVFSQVKDNLQLPIQETGLVLTSDALPTVIGDATQLGQVFQNLVSNAMKFRRASPPTLHIGVSDDAENWVLHFRDNGIGIRPEHYERIFMIFQRLHERGAEYEGEGIGLAVCKRVAERHGGKLWVESEVGVGSTFIFRLPKAQHGSRNKGVFT